MRVRDEESCKKKPRKEFVHQVEQELVAYHELNTSVQVLVDYWKP
jgi:hypothetical protein